MRIISLSVDGIQQAAKRGLFQWLQEQDADLVCLQDLRVPEPVLMRDQYQLEGFYPYYCDTPDGKRNGVAIYTREMPRAVMMGLGFSPDIDLDGCYIRADFAQLSVVSLLTPQALPDPASLEHKMRFFDHLQNHMLKISNKRRKYIFCGNWNIAYSRDDVKNWEEHQATPGFLPHERQWMSQLFNELGYVDAFRRVIRDRDEYSWWPAGSVGEGDAFRYDYQIVSPDLAPAVEYGVMYKNKQFSSHLPVIIDYDLEL